MSGPCEAMENCASEGSGESKDCVSRVIYPRRRPGDDKTKDSGRMQPVHVTQELLETVFNMPLYRACQVLGICETSMKKACRRLGIEKWPYKEIKSKHRNSGGGTFQVSIGKSRVLAISEDADQRIMIHKTELPSDAPSGRGPGESSSRITSPSAAKSSCSPRANANHHAEIKRSVQAAAHNPAGTSTASRCRAVATLARPRPSTDTAAAADHIWLLPQPPSPAPWSSDTAGDIAGLWAPLPDDTHGAAAPATGCCSAVAPAPDQGAASLPGAPESSELPPPPPPPSPPASAGAPAGAGRGDGEAGEELQGISAETRELWESFLAMREVRLAHTQARLRLAARRHLDASELGEGEPDAALELPEMPDMSEMASELSEMGTPPGQDGAADPLPDGLDVASFYL